MAESYEQRRNAKRGARRFFVVSPRMRGFLRVAAYLSVVCFALSFFAARSAVGSMAEQAMIVGRQLSKLEDLTESNNRLVLNGEKIHLASAVTAQPLRDVLDRFETICRDEGVLPRGFARLDQVLQDKLPKPKSGLDLGVLRNESEQEGVIACMVEQGATKDSIFERFTRFSETQDLKDLGGLRYAYARVTDSGRTHVITVWTDGSFKLDAMAPKADGTDTPGSDPANALRPPSSVRLLTAEVHGAPHSVRIYESKAVPNEVLGTYDREMPKLGWEPIKAVEYDVPEARYYSRDGVDLMVVADENGERTAVSVVETRSP